MAEKTKGNRRKTNPLPNIHLPLHLDLSDESANIEAPSTPVHMTIDRNETQYTDSGHWMSILDSIAELKDELDRIASEPQPYSHTSDDAGPELLLGLKTHPTQQDILAGLPPKAESDQLLEAYWRFVDLAPTVMHRPKFEREYDAFWKSPTETPVMWIGMLYGIYSISVRSQTLVEEHDNGIVDPSQRTFSQARQDMYRQKIAQCLILANYTKCPPYTMETFLSYFIVEYLRSRDTQHGIWLLIGMVVRTAFRMGLHREPTRLPNNSLSPFESEMRRRMWSMVVRLDLMSSGQIGLPRMIHPAMTDTFEPGNYTDDDLQEDMTELPPSRPETEFTPMLYAVMRNRILKIFARVVDLNSASEQPTYREVLELDEALRNSYEKMPESLKGLSIESFDLYGDGAMSAAIMSMTFLKALELLHRPFLLLARSDKRYEYSRTACIDAALEILDIQNMLEIAPKRKELGAQLPALWMASSWRLSSLMNHDFLLATSMLIIDLDRDLENPLSISNVSRERLKSGQPTRVEIIDALTRVYDFWTRLSPKSREARKAAAATKHVLGKAGISGFTSDCKFSFARDLLLQTMLLLPSSPRTRMPSLHLLPRLTSPRQPPTAPPNK